MLTCSGSQSMDLAGERPLGSKGGGLVEVKSCGKGFEDSYSILQVWTLTWLSGLRKTHSSIPACLHPSKISI